MTATENTQTDAIETYPRPTERLTIAAADLFRGKALEEARDYVKAFLRDATPGELQLLACILRERENLATLTGAPKELLPDAIAGCMGLVPNSWQRCQFDTVPKKEEQ